MRPALIQLILLSILIFSSYFIIHVSSQSSTILAEYNVAYEFEYNGYIIAPINKNILDDECLCTEEDCLLVGTIKDKDIKLKINVKEYGDRKFITYNINISLDVYKVTSNNSEYACRHNLTYNHTFTLTGDGLIIEGDTVTPLIFYTSTPLGEYHYSIVYYGSGKARIIADPEKASRFKAEIERALVDAGLHDVVSIYLNSTRTGDYIIDLIFNESGVEVIEATGYMIMLQPPPGEDIRVGDIQLYAPETSVASMPEEILVNTDNNTLISYCCNNLMIIKLLDDGNLYVGVFMGWVRTGKVIYHWESGMLLYGELGNLIGPMILSLAYPIPGKLPFLDYDYPVILDDMPLALTINEDDVEQAVLVLHPSNIENYLGSTPIFKKTSIVVHAVDFSYIKNSLGEGISPERNRLSYFITIVTIPIILIILYYYIKSKKSYSLQ